MLLYYLGDAGIKLLDRLAGMLNLPDQELDGHGGRCDQSVVATQQLGGTNTINDRILPSLGADEVFTQDTANQPSIGLSCQHTEQQVQ